MYFPPTEGCCCLCCSVLLLFCVSLPLFSRLKVSYTTAQEAHAATEALRDMMEAAGKREAELREEAALEREATGKREAELLEQAALEREATGKREAELLEQAALEREAAAAKSNEEYGAAVQELQAAAQQMKEQLQDKEVRPSLASRSWLSSEARSF